MTPESSGQDINKIDKMFTDLLSESTPINIEDEPRNYGQFPPISEYTCSTESTLMEGTAHSNSANTVSTYQLNNSKISIRKMDDQGNTELSNEFNKILFEPYNSFFSTTEFVEDTEQLTTAPLEPFFPAVENTISGFQHENDIFTTSLTKALEYDSHNNEYPGRNNIYSHKKSNSENFGRVSKQKVQRPSISDQEYFLFATSKQDLGGLSGISQPSELFTTTHQVYDDEDDITDLEQEKYRTQSSISSSSNYENNETTENMESMNDVANYLPKRFEPIDDLPKISECKHRCSKCFKVSKTSYGCANQIVKRLPNIDLYKEYNTPNGYTLDYAMKHGDKKYVYLASEAKNKYDPLVKRYTLDVQYNSKGKKMKRDYPSLCPFCKVTDTKKFDSLFYERNNSCYRGHLINTHGINSLGEFVKLPTSGFVCYKLGKNSWSETVGFKCPYENCDACFLRGDKTHGFHEYIRHWNRSHLE